MTSFKHILNNPNVILLLVLSLGLAPYVPEPHIVGKVRWIAGGAVGMSALDWGDFLLHGTPWALAIRLGIVRLINALKKSS